MKLALLIAITDLGDGALLLPLALVLALLLWSQQSGAAALAWVAALVPGLAAIAALKLVGHTCEAVFATPTPISPSGHATLATMVYGGAAVIVARHGERLVRALAGVGAVGTVVVIGASRLLLGAHSKAEVVVGTLVGAATVMLFVQLYRRVPRAVLRPHRMAAAAGVTVLLLVMLHGNRLHAEDFIRSIAVELRSQVNVCR